MRSPHRAHLAADTHSPAQQPTHAPAREFRVPADQLPRRVLDRLRHPSAPTYVVTWDRATHQAVWRPQNA